MRHCGEKLALGGIRLLRLFPCRGFTGDKIADVELPLPSSDS